MRRRTMMGVVIVAAVAALLLPQAGRGDVVRLKDGSTLKGRVLSLVGDTLTLRTSFGAELRVPRETIAVVSFTDSLPPAAAGVVPPSTQPAATGGTGRIAVTFVDRKISSKVLVDRGKERDERLRANWIEQSLIVDDQVVYTRVDTVMDKTIYNGPERVYKNDIELEDFEVELPAGLHHAVIVVRNVGSVDHAEWFDGEPLEMSLPLDNTMVVADRSVRVKVGISRGRLRMGSPRLERIE